MNSRNYILFLKISCLVITFTWCNVYAQVQASFSIPASACLNEHFSSINTSQQASSYIWDFCNKDLEVQPTGTTISTLPPTGLRFYAGLKMIFENGNWYGIATASDRNTFFRLDFGSSLTSTPTVTDIGNMGVSTPGAFDLVQENGVTYGFASSGYGSAMARITWGNGITQGPTDVAYLNIGGGMLNGIEGVKALAGNGGHYLFITNNNSGTIASIDLGNSFSNDVQQNKLIGGSAGLVGPWGIDVIREGSNWFGIVTCRNLAKLYLISFGSDLYSDPTFTDIGTLFEGTSVKLVQEGNDYVGIIRSRTFGLYRARFGTSMNSAPVIEYLGYLGVLQNESRSLELVKDSPSWHAFTVDVSNANIHRIDFIGDCQQTMLQNSSSQTDFEQAYKASGSYSIELTAFDNVGNRSSATATINVSNVTATDLSIQVNNSRCLGVPNSFQANSSVPLTQYNWNFSGEGISTQSNPSHQFSQSGSKAITLSITDANGCHSSAISNVTIYNPPIADFNLPTVVGTTCTQQSYAFVNQTIADSNAPLSYSWLVNDVEESTNQNLTYTFQNANTYSIKLVSSIPGCSSNTSKNFAVTGLGTAVNFNFDGQCEGSPTEFVNNTGGSLSSINWDFGDGQVSSQATPIHLYQAIGTYSASLQVTNTSGCVTSQTQDIIITSAPTPDFYIDLPPFSCSGTPTQFHDATLPLTDGNVVSWVWNFSDGGTSSQQNPQHTFTLPGQYSVSLQIESNFGCQGTVQIPVEIAESPVADYTVAAACVNKGTQFHSLGQQGIASWSWTINNTSYSFPDPVHTFSLPGTYSSMLIVVGYNGCEALASKDVIVKPVPVLDFSPSTACVEQAVNFTDLTTGADLPVSWQWTLEPGEIATGSPVSYSFATAGAKPVQLTVMTEAGCSYSITKNVVVAPSPTVSFNTTATFGPPPLFIQFTSTSQNASTLAWDFGFNNATATTNSPTFTYTQLGDYLVQLTATNGAGCSNSTSKIINVLVPNYNLSLETLNIQQNNTSNAKTPVITIKNNSNVQVNSTDVWLTGSSGLKVKSTVSVSLSPGMSQQVTIPVDVFSHEKFLCVEIDLATDSDQADNLQCQSLETQPILLAPYPNPTSGILSFEVVLNASNSGTLQVVDSMGKIVFGESFENLAEGLNRIELDLSNQRSGLYLAIWEVNGHKTEFRFLLQ